MQRVRLELLARHVRQDGRRQAHQAGGLVLGHVAPPVASLALARAVDAAGGRVCAARPRAAAALQITVAATVAAVAVSVAVIVAAAIAAAPVAAVAVASIAPVAAIVAAAIAVAPVASVASVAAIVAAAIAAWLRVTTEAARLPQGDVVRARDSLVPPRHRVDGYVGRYERRKGF